MIIIGKDKKENKMPNRKIVMYTTGCPKCKILEKKLLAKNIEFSKCDDVEVMKSKGISSVPVLEIIDTVPNEELPYTTILPFVEANNWINNH